MGIRIYKPTTSARRKSSVQDFSDITKHKPEKSLIIFKKRASGRNSQGKITVRHRGGGARRYIRIVNFKMRDVLGQTGTVIAIEYDPNRGARIMLVEFPGGAKCYIVQPQGVNVGDTIVASTEKIEPKNGNRMPLEFIPTGLFVHNIELEVGRGGSMVRSAGTGAQLLSIEGSFAIVRMPSGETRRFPKECMATVGMVGNADFRLVRRGKAGRTRWLGFRPSVRGKAMNPVDHPHGGGEGKHPIGMKHPKTPWGKPALGVKTRDPKKMSGKYIIQRRQKKK